MFGFIIGLASLVGLIALLRRRPRRHWMGHRGCHGHHDHHDHHGDYGDHGGRRGGRYGRGNRFGPVWRLFERLDTSPGQEKVIRKAMAEVRDTAKGMRGELKDGRSDVAQALRAESFDETVMGLMFARQDDQIRELQKALTGALAEVHEALEPEQRETLADLLSSSRRGPWGGPYRDFL